MVNRQWSIGNGQFMRYTTPLRIRSAYEAGPDGGLHHGTIVRFALQVGYLIAGAMGMDDAWMAAQGTTFVVRGLKLDYAALSLENEDLNLTTWLTQVRRFRGSREVVLSAVADGRVIANLSLDWVYVRRDTLTPTRFPADMMTQLGEETAHARDWSAWQKPVEPADVVSPAHAVERVVQYHELDINRHVNTGVYVEWLEQAWFEATGQVPSALAGHTLEFLKPAVLGEAVRVTTQKVYPNAWAQTIELAETHETLVTNICFTN